MEIFVCVNNGMSKLSIVVRVTTQILGRLVKPIKLITIGICHSARVSSHTNTHREWCPGVSLLNGVLVCDCVRTYSFNIKRIHVHTTHLGLMTLFKSSTVKY
jgi:hypothetical protein